MADILLFTLDADGRWRLAYDELQWILQKRGSKPGAKSSGFRGVSFIATNKRILLEVIQEKGIQLAPELIERLDALPDTFKEFASTLQQGNRQARKPPDGTRTPARPIDTPTRTPNRHDVAIHIAH